MTVIRWKLFTTGEGVSLCATCTWGTVRRGFRDGEVETFCRLVGLNSPVPFPVRECTDYVDRRAPVPPAEPASAERRYGFVTRLSLDGEEEITKADTATNN